MSNAIAESDFLIAVVTPEAMVSESCGVEYRCFLERRVGPRSPGLGLSLVVR